MRTDADYLGDILDASLRIDSYLSGRSLEEFAGDLMRQDTVLYRLAVIGEAAGRLSKEIRDSKPDVPWKKIIGMRNVLVQDYFHVDEEITYRSATIHVPELAGIVQGMLPPGSSKPPSAPGGPGGT